MKRLLPLLLILTLKLYGKTRYRITHSAMAKLLLHRN